MRILITGATGFVGRHLTEALGAEHYVIAATRQLVEIPGASEVRVVGSIDSHTDWTEALCEVEVVIHLAARVHVMNETSKDPLDSFREVNTRGTRRLMEACAAQGVRRVVLMSSIKVNGEATHGTPFCAHDVPAPQDPYGVSKWEAEQAAYEVAAESDTEVVVLRPTVIYGPGVKGNIQRIIQLVGSRIPLPFGAARNRRTMLSIANLTIWVRRAVTDPAVPQGAVILGDPSPTSTRDLVTGLAAGMGIRQVLIPVPPRLVLHSARLIGKLALAQRLFGDLEAHPTFEAYPGLADELEEPSQGFRALGSWFRASHHQTTRGKE